MFWDIVRKTCRRIDFVLYRLFAYLDLNDFRSFVGSRVKGQIFLVWIGGGGVNVIAKNSSRDILKFQKKIVPI